ncbi:MAG: alpha/beta hydrolase [Bacteroidia bacterium]|nr:alpha/beta hydrolase [Bacteroidia bacterium]MCX7764059.1 alpha/beta hydrolase [Bacteroidia bacterium]MDW8057088.1 alpha/beta hydrolase [Bacteroidia bacterium]
MNQLLPHKRLGTRGPWLVLLHGYMVDGGMFMAVEGAFSQHYRVLIPDLRGYGAAWSWGAPYTFQQRAADVVHLIQSVAGGESVWVLGYSMGGVIAQVLVQSYPDLVRGIILACTFAYKPMTTLERWQGMLLPRLLKMLPPASLANLLYPQTFGSETFPPEVIEWYKKALQRTRLEVLLADAKNIFSFDGRPFLGSIRVPTLVIGGTADLIVPVHHSHFLAEKIPNAQLILYSNAGHALIFTHRRPFVRDIHRFILRASHIPDSPSRRSVLSQSLQ